MPPRTESTDQAARDRAADEVPTADEIIASQPRLGRAGLLIWLGLPFLIVLALWLMMDRSRGQPRPDMSGALGPGQRAPTGGELPPEPAPSDNKPQ